jgi:hypothetical protein
MQYIKVLAQDLLHRGYQWKFGLNSIEVFDDSNGCTPDALYVCEIKNFFTWMTLYPNTSWVGYVTIPEDAQVVIMEDKIKTNKVILHEQLFSLVEFIDIAIERGADINDTAGVALRWASECGYLDIVERLVKYGADVHVLDDFALRYASGNGHLTVVEFLIKNGANVHARDDNALYYAYYNQHLDVVEYLIKNGTDAHSENGNVLKWASANGHLDVVELLVKYNVNITGSAIRLAYRHHHLHIVNYLIKHSPNCWIYMNYYLAILERAINT